MRTEHLEYLVESARCGSMRQAAKNLYCSQPAISNALTALEEELGFPLLERTAAGVAPTAKGGMIIDDAEQIVRLVNRWTEYHGDDADDEIKGDIYAADSGEFGLTFFQDVAMSINERYPKIAMHLVDPGNVLQRINRGSFQIAILPVVPSHSTALSNYLARYHWKMDTLYDDDFKLLINCSHPLARKSAVSIAELDGENLLIHNSFPYRDCFKSIAKSSDIQYENAIKLISAVADRRAIGVFPPSRDTLAYEFEQAGLFKTIPFYDLRLPMRYCLIYWERLTLMPAGQAVIAEMKRSYK